MHILKRFIIHTIQTFAYLRKKKALLNSANSDKYNPKSV